MSSDARTPNTRMPKKYKGSTGSTHLAPTCVDHRGRRKFTYRSKAKARQAAVLSQDRMLYPYLCWNCGLWHLTHHKPKEETT